MSSSRRKATSPTNRGGLCAKGWTAADLLGHPERLLSPLVRDERGSALRRATWNEALERVVAGFHRAQRDHGPNAVGCFGGGGLTNEKAYQLGKFARVALRTSAIDYNGRFCMSSAAAATNRSFGIDRGLPFGLADVAQADVILLVGGNPAETMPPAMQFFDEGRARGAKHIVVDPRRTATAARADLHLQPVPGTDLALANGMLNVVAREGLIDDRYVTERTAGFEAVRRAARLYWPDRVERITGVPEDDIVTAARMLAKADRAMILTEMVPSHTRGGADKYRIPMIKLTGGQRIDLLGVRKEDLPSVWADLGMPSGYAYGKSFRTVKTCVGSDFCRHGLGDSTALGIAIEERFQGIPSPGKMKLAVTGCPRNCAEALCKDVGVVAIEGGQWQIYVGGAAGAHVRKGDLLTTVDTPDEVIALTGRFLQYYRENANWLERTYDFVPRVGIDRIRAIVVTDSDGIAADLDAHMQKSVDSYRDPWMEGRNAPTPSQFRSSLPLIPLPQVPVR